MRLKMLEEFKFRGSGADNQDLACILDCISDTLIVRTMFGDRIGTVPVLMVLGFVFRSCANHA